MGSPLPPDPYAALGVDRNATAAAIKTAYRKLALKSHPDKFPDAEKAQKADEFHRIQQAYEILADDDRRERYNAQVRLAELRKEALERGMRSEPPRPATYDVRTPHGAYSARDQKPKPEPKTRAAYDSDERIYDDARSRRRTTKVSFSYSRGPSPERRRERERIRVFSFGSSSTKYERTRDSKARSQEKKRGTEDKFSRVNEEADDSDRFEDRRRWRSYEEEERRRDDEYKKVAEAERRAAEAERQRDEATRHREDGSRRSSKMRRDDPYVTPKVEEAMEYIRSSRTTPRGGTSSSDDARPFKSSYEKVRPSASRRSSGKSQKDPIILASMRHGSGRREKMPEIYERLSSPDDAHRRRPTLEKADTMPSKYSSPKVNLERSATMDSYDRRDAPRTVRRSETLPEKSTEYPYERPAANSSKPRDAHMDSGYSSPSAPSTPTPPEREHRHHKYHYSEDGGVPLGDGMGYHTVVVEPGEDDVRRRSSSSQERMRSSREEDRPTATTTRANRRPATHGAHHRSFDEPRESQQQRRGRPAVSSRHMASSGGGPIPMTHSPEREYPEPSSTRRAAASPVAGGDHQAYHHHHSHSHHHPSEPQRNAQPPHHRRGSLWETSPPPPAGIPKHAGRPSADPVPSSTTTPAPAPRSRQDAGYTYEDVIWGPRLRSGFSSNTASKQQQRNKIPQPSPITHPSVSAYESKGGAGGRGESSYPFPHVHLSRPPLVKRTTVS